jgi:hypothetical protein
MNKVLLFDLDYDGPCLILQFLVSQFYVSRLR